MCSPSWSAKIAARIRDGTCCESQGRASSTSSSRATSRTLVAYVPSLGVHSIPSRGNLNMNLALGNRLGTSPATERHSVARNAAMSSQSPAAWHALLGSRPLSHWCHLRLPASTADVSAQSTSAVAGTACGWVQ